MDFQADNLKKMLMHNILNTDYESQERPMSIKEEKVILEKFISMEQDEFSLMLVKNKFEAGKLFSKKALEKFLMAVRLFIGGRILGHYNKTGKEPEVVRVRIIVEHLTHKEYGENYE